MTDHQFCPRHRIAYNALLDPICPQCMLARTDPPAPLDFDVRTQRPLNAAGKQLDPRTLQEVV